MSRARPHKASGGPAPPIRLAHLAVASGEDDPEHLPVLTHALELPLQLILDVRVAQHVLHQVLLQGAPHVSKMCSSTGIYEIGKWESSNLVSPNCLATLNPLLFRINFRISLYISAKKAAGL